MRHRDGITTTTLWSPSCRPCPGAPPPQGGLEPGPRASPSILAAHDWHIVTGAGNAGRRPSTTACASSRRCSGSARGPVHASDFFHGTLELVEEGVSVILLKGEDECASPRRPGRGLRPRHDGPPHRHRHRRFRRPGCRRDCGRCSRRPSLATMLERVSAHLEVMRDHPLTTRRYYRRVAY